MTGCGRYLTAILKTETKNLKNKNWGLADILAPGEVADILRDLQGSAAALAAGGLVVVTLVGGEVSVRYGGSGITDDYHACGLLEAASAILLEADDNE